MCVRLITGQDKQLEDIREKEINENERKPHTNGFSREKKEE